MPGRLNNFSISNDKGQTIPLYLVAAVALLFVALAFFAVGQAESSRNETQTAADAAALAAAQDARDGMRGKFLGAVEDGDLGALEQLLDGRGFGAPGSCGAAGDYAVRNDADLVACDPVFRPAGYRVEVRAQKSVGRSVVEGTENKHAEAKATAVIEPRCGLSEDQGESGVGFTCQGVDRVLDPEDGDLELDLGDFFRVRLSE